MGLMSYDPTTPTDVTTYAPFDKSLFNAGSTIKDGKLCGLYLDQSMIEYGIIFLWYGWFDLETGEYDGEVTNVSNRSLIAYATATDPKTGEVFGEFTDQTMQSWEFGVVDYDTKTRTTIAETDNLYLAMGITSQGRLLRYHRRWRPLPHRSHHGRGDPYRLDGSPCHGCQWNGLFPANAVVDPKTDVFYWAATDANGECTLYTVDLDDASVTRVCASPYQQLALNVLPPLAEDKALLPSMTLRSILMLPPLPARPRSRSPRRPLMAMTT